MNKCGNQIIIIDNLIPYFYCVLVDTLYGYSCKRYDEEANYFN